MTHEVFAVIDDGDYVNAGAADRERFYNQQMLRQDIMNQNSIFRL